MKKSMTIISLVAVSLLAGCAATGDNEYVKVYDRKYNEVRLVEKKDPGEFVGTSAVKRPARPAGQHP